MWIRKGYLTCAFVAMMTLTSLYAIIDPVEGSSAPVLMTEGSASEHGRFFTENRGQWDEDLRFVSDTAFGHMGIGSDSIIYDIGSTNEKACVLKIQFQEGDPDGIYGHGQLPFYHNYFVGSPDRWASRVPNFQEVIYEDVWGGVDIYYSIEGSGHPKYDIIIPPHCDPSGIGFKVSGQEDILSDGKDLMITTPTGEKLIDSDPIAFYEDNGESIPVEFSMISHDTYGFRLGSYDPSRTVVIDPLIYSTFVGGSSDDRSMDIAVDSDGNSYIGGYTGSYDFPVTPGVYDPTNSGVDVFISKMNPQGSSLIYSTYVGGSSGDYGYSIALDSQDRCYLSGYTESSNFPTTSDDTDLLGGNNDDIFVLKLKSDGTELLYSVLVGGNSDELGYDIEVDTQDQAHVTGMTRSVDFPISMDAFQSFFGGGTGDAVHLIIGSSGDSLVFSTYIGGNDYDMGLGLDIGDDGNVYICGETESNDFPTTSGSFEEEGDGSYYYLDGFALKLNMTLKTLDYSTYISGRYDDIAYDIKVDSHGDAAVCGLTTSDDFPITEGAYDNQKDGSYEDAFVLELNSKGSGLHFSTYIGGQNGDTGLKIERDENDNLFMLGATASTGFPKTSGAYDISHNGGVDGTLVKLNHNGTQLLYSTFLGGLGDDYSVGFELVDNYTAYISGYTTSTDFPVT